MYSKMPPWLKSQANSTYHKLQSISRKDFESRKIKPQPFVFVGAVLNKRFSRRLSGYSEKIRPTLSRTALDGRLVAIQEIAAGLGIEVDPDELEAYLIAGSEYDANWVAESLVDTYDAELQEVIRTSLRDGEEQGLENEALAAFMIGLIITWHEDFSKRQNQLVSITEGGRGHGEGWRLFGDDNPRAAIIVNVVPDYHCPRCDLCGSALSGNPWLFSELQSTLGIPPGDFHPRCIHSISWQRIEGFEGQMVNIAGKPFRL